MALGFDAADPTGYGRLLVRDGALVAIREHKDATEAERAVTLCFAGPMALDGAGALGASGRVTLRFVDNRGAVTERYPANPNGSPQGITGITNQDGRITLTMPHAERTFRTVIHSWHPDDWGEDGPWMQMYRNARTWLG